MSRIIEIVLFVTPFVAFAAWRLLFPSAGLTPRMLYGTAGFVLLMLAALFWLHQQDAADAGRVYVPAALQDGRIVPGHAAPPR
jgi:hypothetical protein